MIGAELFAGIGGFGLAMERAGITVRTAVEIDDKAREVYASHFPQTTLLQDVRRVHLGTGIDILTAGWPCQGNSVAGRRGGMADPRSGLWREVVRVVGESRPAWFVGENVPGLLTVRGGADFYEVVAGLDELGYGLAWRVLDAQFFGVPQRRRRVILVGRLGDAAGPAEVLFEPESGDWDYPPSSAAGEGTPRAPADCPGDSGSVAVHSTGLGYWQSGVGALAVSGDATGVNLIVSTLQGGGRRGYRIDAEAAAGGHLIPVAVDNYNFLASEPDGPAFTLTGGRGGYTNRMVATPRVRRLTPLECERLQGFPDGWTAGQSDAARYRQTGNAVAVPVAEWIMRRITQLATGAS